MRLKKCAVQNGELNPCLRQEKLKEVLLGHQPYRMAKALGDHSMVEKHETGEHARLVVVQDPRDTVKAGLPESQSPGMEAHIHRHGMYGRCWWDRTVRVAPFELSPRQTTTNEVVQGVERGIYVALGHSIRPNTGSPTGREGDGAAVVVRGRESLAKGARRTDAEVAAMARAEAIQPSRSTGKPDDTERVMSGLGRGCRKSAASGNSPAPYSTSCPVLRGLGSGNGARLPDTCL